MGDAGAADTEISPEELRDAADDVELVDVRQAYEWEAGRIAGARHIEMNELTSRAEELPRDRAVVFYCRGGNRSAMAAEAFRQAGYDARNLAGGISAWSELGMPLDPADGEVAGPLPPS